MKSPSSPDRLLGIIEPLEARIAPAQVFIGDPNPLNNLDTEYIETNPVPAQVLQFEQTSAKSSNPGEFEGNPNLSAEDPISRAVDGQGVGTYFMRLKAG